MIAKESALKIVIIDDDELVLESTLSFLADEGFITTGFNSHLPALLSINNEPPDVCIVDYRMPDIDGEELVILIKKSSPAIRCLIYTGAPIILTNTLRQYGITESDIILKPINDFDAFVSLLLQRH